MGARVGAPLARNIRRPRPTRGLGVLKSVHSTRNRSRCSQTFPLASLTSSILTVIVVRRYLVNGRPLCLNKQVTKEIYRLSRKLRHPSHATPVRLLYDRVTGAGTGATPRHNGSYYCYLLPEVLLNQDYRKREIKRMPLPTCLTTACTPSPQKTRRRVMPKSLGRCHCGGRKWRRERNVPCWFTVWR